MIKEKSCGTIIFRKDKEIKYLLLKYGLGHWDFPRGLIEENETEQEATLREIKEETGISNVKFISGFKEKIHFFFREKGELVSKEVVYLLTQTKTKDVKLSYEHLEYAWLNYEGALEKLKFKNAKEVLKKAHKKLNESLLSY